MNCRLWANRDRHTENFFFGIGKGGGKEMVVLLLCVKNVFHVAAKGK